MFLTRLGQTWLFCHNIIPYHNPFLSYAVLLRYLRWTFIPSPYKHTFMTLLFLSKCNSLCSLGEFFFSWNKIFYQLLHFSQVFRKKKPFTIFGISRLLWRVFIFFGLIICFISFPFYSLVWFLEFWESIYYFARETCFTIFYVFVKLRSLDYIFTIWECFVLITYLQCNIFICLRYLWRTIFLRLNNMFFRIAFVSDTWEEPYYFTLIRFFSVFYLSQIPGKNHVTLPQ